ncbi:MAG: NAD(P)H-dependent oxidoreductase, partial [Planctomycetes bacterium]|nr:NAD(P)H-dependent oxidoreductase [Planctomycetota bacterium]
MTPRILIFAGSTRTDSWNKKLARSAAEIASAAGAEATCIDL